MRIIQLSDLHIRGDEYNLFGLNPLYRFKKAIESINKNYPEAEFIVITGDLAHKSNLNAYKQIKKIISQSKIKVYLLIGNHDNRDDFYSVFNDVPKNGGFVNYSIEKNGFAFIFLDTKIPNTHAGDLCEKRYEWLENELKKHSSKNCFVFMHHHPVKIGIDVIDDINFRSNERFLNLLKKYGVKHIFFGHIHRNVFGITDGIGYFGIRSTNHQLALVNSGREFLSIDEKPNFAVIDINKNSVNINLHEYLDEEKIILYDEESVLPS